MSSGLPRVFVELGNPHVQSSLQASNNTGILNTCTWLWPTESEQATPVVSIKDVVWSSMKVLEFDKHLKKAGGHIGRNVVEITKMKTIVQKTLMIKKKKAFILQSLVVLSQQHQTVKYNNYKRTINKSKVLNRYWWRTLEILYQLSNQNYVRDVSRILVIVIWN